MRASIVVFASLVAGTPVVSAETLIVGQVSDATTHRPVAGALVTAGTLGGNALDTHTNVNGIYRLQVLDGGAYSLLVVYGSAKADRIVTVDRNKIGNGDTVIDLERAGEVIVIHDPMPPVVAPKPVEDARRSRAPK